MTSEQIKKFNGYCDKQHDGNIGEGQFHINNKTFIDHKQYLIKEISYQQLYNIIK